MSPRDSTISFYKSSTMLPNVFNELLQRLFNIPSNSTLKNVFNIVFKSSIGESKNLLQILIYVKRISLGLFKKGLQVYFKLRLKSAAIKVFRTATNVVQDTSKNYSI